MALPRVALLLGVGVLVVGCSSAPAPGKERLGSLGQPIVNGTASDASQNFVVLVVHPDASTGLVYACSGTLLAPNLVLTARHCVSATADQPFTCDTMGNGSSGGAVGADFTPNTIYVFTGTTRPANLSMAAAHGVQIFHDGATNTCNHDLALLGLDTAIPNAMIAQIRLDSPPTAGETVTSVGWGVTTTDPAPPIRQQRTGVQLLHVGPFTDTTYGADVPPNEFDVGESICQGDSGGPALDATTNAVIGVVSRGGNGVTGSNPATGCLDMSGSPVFNWYTDTSAFADLIRQAAQAAGQDPWLEGGPDPRLAKFGDPCIADGDCQSDTCVITGSAGTCTQDCSSTPCPGGYSCEKVSGLQICLTAPGGGAGGSKTSSSSGCAVAADSRGAGPTGGGRAALAGLFVGLAACFRASRRSRSTSRRGRSRSS